MDISSSLIAKGTAGALAAAATTAGVIYRDQLFGNYLLTQFDQGLIDFLWIDGADIVFDVKKGTGDENFTEGDLTFNTSDKTLPITVKVIVDTSNTTNLKEKDDNEDPKGKITTLQKLNGGNENNTGGTAWTWSCEIKFETEETTPLIGKSINHKNKIIKANNGGLLGILKKNEAANGTNNETKNIKEKFIRFCAKKRGSEKNKQIDANGIPTEEPNNLKAEIKIDLKLGVDGAQDGKTDTNKLYPSDKKEEKRFKELFGEIKDPTVGK